MLVTVTTKTKTFDSDFCRASILGENSVLRLSVLKVGIQEAVETFVNPEETKKIIYVNEEEEINKTFSNYTRLIAVSLFADNSGVLITLSKEEPENA